MGRVSSPVPIKPQPDRYCIPGSRGHGPLCNPAHPSLIPPSPAAAVLTLACNCALPPGLRSAFLFSSPATERFHSALKVMVPVAPPSEQSFCSVGRLGELLALPTAASGSSPISTSCGAVRTEVQKPFGKLDNDRRAETHSILGH